MGCLPLGWVQLEALSDEAHHFIWSLWKQRLKLLGLQFIDEVLDLLIIRLLVIVVLSARLTLSAKSFQDEDKLVVDIGRLRVALFEIWRKRVTRMAPKESLRLDLLS